ncbi:MAG TPA: tetratricopeptide repeat protein [Xanthobacteraceae bacterium]
MARLLMRWRWSPSSAARVFLVGLLGVFALGVLPARAASVCFGSQEYLRSIQDVTITGQNGEALYLGFKYSFHCFIAPYSVSDDGYILGIKGESKRYYRLDPARIASYQARGQLPTPLPRYELSAFDYAFGHMLWAMPFVIAAFYAFDVVKKKRGRERRQRANPYFATAFAAAEKGDVAGAIADYTKAIEADPAFEAALLDRGMICERQGNLDAAIADYGKAIKIGPAAVTARGLIIRGLAYEKKGDLDRAIADYTRVIRQSGGAGAYFLRGKARLAKGDHRRAIKDFTKAINLDPHAAVAYQARADAYTQQGDGARAQADHEAARAAEARQRAAAGSAAS